MLITEAAMADEIENENEEVFPFAFLPEACVSSIISLTSPKDACIAAAVSSEFKSASESDTVWDRLLPPDYEEIISASNSTAVVPTKKALYFMLCDPGLLLDGGGKSFTLSRPTGKKCYMLCARELEIAWGDTPRYWTWTSLPESRFTEVAVLEWVCWLEICAVIPAQILSPKTNYAAYLVFKVTEGNSGLQTDSKASVKFVKDFITEFEGETRTVYMVPPRFGRVMRGRTRRARLAQASMSGRFPCNRADGWKELQLGEFFIGDGNEFDVHIRFFEIESGNRKGGLIVEGIELGPKI